MQFLSEINFTLVSTFCGLEGREGIRNNLMEMYTLRDTDNLLSLENNQKFNFPFPRQKYFLPNSCKGAFHCAQQKKALATVYRRA